MRVPSQLRLGALRSSVSAAAGRASRRPGYDASEPETLRRVLPMLDAEPVVWLSTVSPDGLPHLIPTWFWWDGEALRVFSRPNAAKVRNLRARPRLMVALGRPEDDFAVALIEAEATCLPGPAAIPGDFFRKYVAELEAAGLDRATFRATYTQAIRIVPTRFLPWRGRGPRHDIVATAPSASPSLRASLLPAWA